MINEIQDGIMRSTTSRGKGFWLVRWKGEEKVFYDGVFGTQTAARNAAEKWYKSLTTGSQAEQAYEDKVRELVVWLESKEADYSRKVIDEVEDAIVRIMLPHMQPEAKPTMTITQEEFDRVMGKKG